jgi:hypothetical protein
LVQPGRPQSEVPKAAEDLTQSESREQHATFFDPVAQQRLVAEFWPEKLHKVSA